MDHHRSTPSVRREQGGVLSAEEWGVALGRSADPAIRYLIAAVALHGQPHGFTWTDVHQLGEAANVILLADREMVDLAFQLDELADRIAALLPPPDVK
jgi:hypothetical protein